MGLLLRAARTRASLLLIVGTVGCLRLADDAQSLLLLVVVVAQRLGSFALYCSALKRK